MIRMYQYLIAAVLCLFSAAAAIAQSPSGLLAAYQKAAQQGQSGTRLEIDNDSLLLNRNDGLYSSGLRLVHQHMLRDEDGLHAFGWRIGQQLYTASDTNLSPQQVLPPDHPYAGWLYGGFFREVERADGSSVTVGVDVGCLGPCAGGEWTQTNLHRLLNQPLPQGWDKQVRQEWGMIVYGRMMTGGWQLAPWLHAKPVFHGRFGNIHTDAGFGLLLRAGQTPATSQPVGLHGFLRADISAVVYNAMLQGGYFSSGNPHTVRPRRVVGELEMGLGWNGPHYGITASIVHRGNEIDELPNSQGAQNFVRLLFSYAP